MRFLVPAVLLTGVLVLAIGAVSNNVTPAAAAASTEARLSPSDGRLGGGQIGAQPEWFGGKWWKKFRRAMDSFLKFIDALLDDLRNHPGDKPGGVSEAIGHSPAVQPAAERSAPRLA